MLARIKRKQQNISGFTLIELMIVIGIIGILAAIAIPNFLIYQLRSKTAEARYSLGSIKTTSVAYRSEHDFYVKCAANPGIVPGTSKVAWVVPNGDFDLIGFSLSGDVYYSYFVIPGITGITTSFIAMAEGDLDNNGGVGAAPGGLTGGAAVGTGAAIAGNGLFSLEDSGTIIDENFGVW